MPQVNLRLCVDPDGSYEHVYRVVDLPFVFEGMVLQNTDAGECTILDDYVVSEVAVRLDTGGIEAEVKLRLQPSFGLTVDRMKKHGWVA